MNTAQKRLVIEAPLKETPSISSRAIAGMLKVDHKTVSAARERLVSTGEIPQFETTQGLDGRERRKPIRTMFLPERENVRELKAVAKAIRTSERETSRRVRADLINEIAARGRVAAGEMPRAAFSVLYADPPWEQEAWSDETGQDRDLPYPPMPLDAIKALCAGDKSPATPDAVIFLWATANRLADAIEVMRDWGFAYVTCLVWDKETIGMGRWVRDRHELLLIGKRCNFPSPLPGTQPASVHSERKGAHSAKPAFFAEVIERLYPDMRSHRI